MNNIVRSENANSQGTSSVRRTRTTETTSVVTSFNEAECKEAIAQNILQINNIMEFGNFNSNKGLNKESNDKEESINCIDLSKRKLIRGQWVDVKDTVDQWLEAQVINVKEDSVLIHYNRWGTRWDEWIDMSSDRIMPFRFHTRQASITNYNSPFPNSKPDANVSLTTSPLQQDQVSQYKNFLEVVNDVIAINHRSNSLFEQIKQNDEKDKEQRQIDTVANMKKLLPIWDKLGRAYIDMSAYINNLMKKNKFEELNEDIFYDAVRTNPMLKPYTSDEQKAVNDELMAKNSQRTVRSGTLHFIPPSNRLDRQIVNQIPLVDTPLTISNRSLLLQPVLDVYVHTFVYPSTIASRGLLDNQTSSRPDSPLPAPSMNVDEERPPETQGALNTDKKEEEQGEVPEDKDEDQDNNKDLGKGKSKDKEEEDEDEAKDEDLNQKDKEEDKPTKQLGQKRKRPQKKEKKAKKPKAKQSKPVKRTSKRNKKDK